MSDYGTKSQKYAEAMKWRDWQTCDLIADEHLALVEEITKLKEALREAVEVVGFYADASNWHDSQDRDYDHLDIDQSDASAPEGYCDRRGGRRAREFQSKHAAIIAEINPPTMGDK